MGLIAKFVVYTADQECVTETADQVCVSVSTLVLHKWMQPICLPNIVVCIASDYCHIIAYKLRDLCCAVALCSKVNLMCVLSSQRLRVYSSSKLTP